jgi:hypothetical protein
MNLVATIDQPAPDAFDLGDDKIVMADLPKLIRGYLSRDDSGVERSERDDGESADEASHGSDIEGFDGRGERCAGNVSLFQY